MFKSIFLAATLSCVLAQQAGTQTKENHPKLTVSKCTKSGGCTSVDAMVTIDGNWRWTHSVGGATNCYTGNSWDATLCPDDDTCAQNCALEGADQEYKNTYGISTEGDALTLNYVTNGQYSKNIGSRVYLMEDDDTYQMFDMRNKEISFDIDDSKLVCGLNGAVYWIEMDKHGGMGVGNNKAGAKYGTGYCDAQCPHDMKFINGKGNVEGWKPSPDDPNTGTGKYGTCCTEMDLWEGNSISTALTPHACDTGVAGPFRCEGTQCGDNGPDRFKGVCDKNGCDFQTFRLGNKTFWGPGSSFNIDTTQKSTVVTQFLTTDGTDTGDISEIRRFFVQNGKKIPYPTITLGGSQFDSITEDYCKAEVATYKDNTNFLEKGGFKQMSKSMANGMVLAISLWSDDYAHMLWLDGEHGFPANATQGPGTARGTCADSSGVPADVEKEHPDASYTISAIKWGEIGSTSEFSSEKDAYRKYH